MGRRTREEAAATRERVIASAAHLARAHGVQGVTLEQVARDIGMTRGAIYGHFRTRAELLDTLLCRAEADLESRLARAPAQLEHLLAALLQGDELARNVSLLTAVLQHKCATSCELCPLRARVLRRGAWLRDRLAAWLPEPERVHLLMAHLWGLLSAQSLHLAPAGLAQHAGALARLYAGDGPAPCAFPDTARGMLLRDIP